MGEGLNEMATKEISEKQRMANLRRAEHLRKLSNDPVIREQRRIIGRKVMEQLNADPAFREAAAQRNRERPVTDRMRENSREMMKLNRQSPPKGQWGNGSAVRPARKADPRLAALTLEQRRIYKKLRGCGISKDEALHEATKL
jgi:hypothetical protein